MTTENEVKYPNEIQEFYYKELKWCACGNASATLEFMRDVLAAIDAKTEIILTNRPFNSVDPEYEAAWEKLKNLFPCDYYHPLVESYLKTLDTVGLLEHGGSIGGAWLSDKGEKILKLLQSYPLDDAMEEM